MGMEEFAADLLKAAENAAREAKQTHDTIQAVIDMLGSKKASQDVLFALTGHLAALVYECSDRTLGDIVDLAMKLLTEGEYLSELQQRAVKAGVQLQIDDGKECACPACVLRRTLETALREGTDVPTPNTPVPDDSCPCAACVSRRAAERDAGRGAAHKPS